MFSKKTKKNHKSHIEVYPTKYNTKVKSISFGCFLFFFLVNKKKLHKTRRAKKKNTKEIKDYQLSAWRTKSIELNSKTV